MMNHAITRHILWGVLLLLPSLFFAQRIDTKARVVGNDIIVRWVPDSYDTWQTGITNGYRIMIRQLDANGTTISLSLTDTIYPSGANEWGDVSGDDALGLAHALLYNTDQSIYEGAQGAFNQEEDKKTRFHFTLFAADMSVEAATHLGLAFTHQAYDPNYHYEYLVRMVDMGTSTSSVAIDPTNIPLLPQPDSLRTAFGDGEFMLSWYKGDLPAYYTSYDIEYSTDGGTTFNSMNEKPFVNMDADADEEVDYLFYHHAIDNDISEYQFRIRGYSLFGEYGPYSEIVSGRGQPTPLPMIPQITEVTEMQDSSFRVQWVLNEDLTDSIDHINLWRYDDYPNTHSNLNAAPLAATTREFTDDNAGDINYYRLEVVDVGGASSYSPLAIGERYDSIPPLPPVNLLGEVDTIMDTVSMIHLSWEPNQEEDLYGYYIYASNGAEQEYVNLTSGGVLTDTVYQDTILNFTLGETIYYKVKAVDFTGNISDFSASVAVDRPDLIPPVPPAFVAGGVSKSSQGLTLNWLNSTSKDVVGYRVQRKPIGQPDAAWESVKSSPVTGEKRSSYLAPLAEEAYWYRVMVTDDAGNVAVSDSVKHVVSPVEKSSVPTTNFALQTQTQAGKALIKWQVADLANVKSVMIYKSVNDGPIRSLVRIPVEELNASDQNGTQFYTYLDRFCTEGNNYEYVVQLCYDSGNNSNVSAPVSIGF